MSYFVPLFIIVALCFGLQSLALHLSGGRTTKSESNFFSSIARIQSGSLGNPSIMLLGSSRTGRLPDRLSGFPDVANLGCDGGTAAVTLRAIDRGQLPAAGTIVIEGTTLLHDLKGWGHETSVFIDSPWFNIGQKIPALAASARPSALIYSALLQRKWPKEDSAVEAQLPLQSVPDVVNYETVLPQDAQELVEELRGIAGRLRERGCNLLIVMLPPATGMDSLNHQIAYALSHEANIPLWDLAENLPADAVRLTDGVHMDPASAATTLRTVLQAIEHR